MMSTLENAIKTLFLSIFLIILSGCGGDNSDSSKEPQTASGGAKSCTTADEENNSDECGTLLLGLTDADGDFLTYSVNITGIELTRSDGLQVSVMPSTQTVDFTQYVEASELATAATVPAGIYTSGSITIDYSSADIQVEKNNAAVSADMIDADGNPLLSQTLSLQLDGNNRLHISRNRPAMLELDFNLAASHTVHLDTDPVTVTTEPYIIAEVDPIMSKEFRVRGPLLRVNETESYFRIAVRPFHRRDGRFGGVNVETNNETNFEINGEAYTGVEGLSQMKNLEAGAATLTLGTFNREDDRFTAITVMAGSSVPGHDKDAAKGVIIARNDNTLTIRGAALIRQDSAAVFRDEINVLIAQTTRVFKPRRINDAVSIDDLSVGQAITILGDVTSDNDSTIIDATNGAIKMRLTFASGHVLSKNDILLTMNLQALQGRSPEIYDFSGTGIDPSSDADPDQYEVSIQNLIVSDVEASDPVRISGFVTPFGSAPNDFEALNVINYSESKSAMLLDWPEGNDVTAFSAITNESLTVNTVESGLYKLIQGGIRTDITTFDTAVVIQPKDDRGIYTFRNNDTIRAFSNFADFVTALQTELAKGQTIDRLHAMGGFSNNSKVFSAVKLAIKLD